MLQVMCAAGATVGGLNGLYTGVKETRSSQLAGAVRRTQYVTVLPACGFCRGLATVCTLMSSICTCPDGLSAGDR